MWCGGSGVCGVGVVVCVVWEWWCVWCGGGGVCGVGVVVVWCGGSGVYVRDLNKFDSNNKHES